MIISRHVLEGVQPGYLYRDQFEECAVKGTLDLINIVSNHAWSPIVWAGGVRKSSNFIRSDFLVLDFDKGVSIVEAEEIFKGFFYVLMTTKSHQVAKALASPCDRFRVILPFEYPVTSKEDYEHTLKIYSRENGADTAAADAARFFYPCTKEVIRQGRGFKIVPSKYEPDQDELYLNERKDTANKDRYEQFGMLPPHMERFLNEGRPFGEGRNESCFMTSRFLAEMGLKENEIFKIINQGKFDRKGFREAEIHQAIKSALQKVRFL